MKSRVDRAWMKSLGLRTAAGSWSRVQGLSADKTQGGRTRDPTCLRIHGNGEAIQFRASRFHCIRLFYQFHYYCWDRPSKLNDITRFLNRRTELNASVWVSETGEKDNAVSWATMPYFETNNIGWSFWPWKRMETTNTPYSIKTPQGWDAIRAYTRSGTNRLQVLVKSGVVSLDWIAFN